MSFNVLLSLAFYFKFTCFCFLQFFNLWAAENGKKKIDHHLLLHVDKSCRIQVCRISFKIRKVKSTSMTS